MTNIFNIESVYKLTLLLKNYIINIIKKQWNTIYKSNKLSLSYKYNSLDK